MLGRVHCSIQEEEQDEDEEIYLLTEGTNGEKLSAPAPFIDKVEDLLIVSF